MLKEWEDVHYCLLCDGVEVCAEERCDFRNMLLAHGECYAMLSEIDRRAYDEAIEVLKKINPKLRKT